jgi:predicted ATPase/class 3 adenylate cyclase
MDGRLPDGVVTFLFTDVEGSTRLWEDAPNAMMEALDAHDSIIDAVLQTRDGVSVKPRGEGDSRFIVFGTATDAVAAAAEIQQRLAAFDWNLPRPLRVRASLHTGQADLQLGDYYGPVVNRAARMRAIAHGGQTVLSSTTWELIQDQLPDGVTVRDMGEHALKDLTRPEHIYQLAISGVNNEFPPLASLDNLVNNLPLQLNEFIGREHELEEAKRLLSQTRLLTILAPGGAGKTRLAIQVGADLISNYSDGVFFVDLAAIRHSEEIVHTIAESIGLIFSAEEADQTQLHRYLSNKTQLLILDNFEHVIEGATVVTGILESAVGVSVLATSRSKLRLSGETILALGGLDTAWGSPEEALRISGVRLFLEASKRAKPGFSLAHEDLDYLSRILAITGGMPLAILLAASWTDMLSVGEIAEEISRSVDFLESEMGDIPDRHRSVRAVFDYSWGLLSEDERMVFSALSVFRGGFTREAASEVAGASIRQLANLAAKSLLVADPDTARYTVHELLRQFAEAELRTDIQRAASVEAFHADYYAGLADRAYELFPVSDQIEMMRVLEDDIDNLRIAWRHHTAQKQAEHLRRMIPPLHLFYEVRSRFPDGVALMQELIDAFEEASDDPSRVVMALATEIRCWFRALLGQPEFDNPARAATTLRESGDRFALWLGLQGAALNYSYLGRIDEMIAITDEAIAVAEEFGDAYWVAGAKNWRCLAAVQAQDLENANVLANEARGVLEERHDHYFITWTLLLQASIAVAQDRMEDAAAIYTLAVDVCQEVGYARGTMLSLEGLGKTNLAQGNLMAARKAFTESLAVAERTSMLTDLLGMMAKVGNVCGLLGDVEFAVEVLATVLAHPLSAGHTITDPQTAEELASDPMERLRQQLSQETFDMAVERGSKRPYEDLVKELLARDATTTRDTKV